MPARSHPHRREFLRRRLRRLRRPGAGVARCSRATPRRLDDPLAPEAAALPSRRRRAVIFLFMAGGPSHLDTFDPKPLLNKLNGQPRPAEFGEAKYQFVPKGAKLLGSARKFAKHGKSGVEVSDLFPHTAEVHRRHRRGPVVPLRQGGPLGGAVRAVQRAGGARVPERGLVGRLRARVGEPSRCRGTSSCPTRTGRWRPGSRCTPTASCPRSTSRPCSAAARGRSATSTSRRASSPDERQKTVRADPRPERGERRRPTTSSPPASAPTTWRSGCRPRPRSCSTSRRRRRRRSTSTASAREPTDDYGRRCLLARRLVENGRAVRGRRVRRRAGEHAVGRPQGHRGEPQADGRPDRPAGRRPADRPEAARAARLDAGAVGRGVRPVAGGPGRGRAATTTTSGSRCGWPAAGSRAGRPSARPTRSGCGRSRSPYHVRDVHTTILHQLGLDQDKLTFPHLGRRERLTLVEGKVIKQIV